MYLFAKVQKDRRTCHGLFHPSKCIANSSNLLACRLLVQSQNKGKRLVSYMALNSPDNSDSSDSPISFLRQYTGQTHLAGLLHGSTYCQCIEEGLTWDNCCCLYCLDFASTRVSQRFPDKRACVAAEYWMTRGCASLRRNTSLQDYLLEYAALSCLVLCVPGLVREQ